MSCFVEKIEKKGVTYNAKTGEVLDCLFCRIIRREEAGTIVYEDEDCVAFKTIAPATHTHYLVTPKAHIQNIASLFSEVEKGERSVEDAIAVLERLTEVGRKALGDELSAEAKYSFHIPPLNSIDHLHLHAIASPRSMSWITRMKYPLMDTFYCRNVQSLIADLRLLQAKKTKNSQT